MHLKMRNLTAKKEKIWGRLKEKLEKFYRRMPEVINLYHIVNHLVISMLGKR